jgi:hypothetical protein
VEIWAGDEPGGTLYMAVWRVRTLGRSDVRMFGNRDVLQNTEPGMIVSALTLPVQPCIALLLFDLPVT